MTEPYNMPVETFKTASGTSYLRSSYVDLLSKPNFELDGLRRFIGSFDDELKFKDYFDDIWEDEGDASDGDLLDKVAGQLCYLSFGPGRTKNNNLKKYFDNIKSSGHGSVFEHSNFTLLFFGIDRSVTHEIVRHRAGFGFSQVSQRYVDGKALRFVERPEFQIDGFLHDAFLKRIDDAKVEYDKLAEYLADQIGKDPLKAELPKTDRRKLANQAARACLPNETEAPIVVTANARGWRHFLEQRASGHADNPIRILAIQAHEVLTRVTSELFADYEKRSTVDGREYLDSKTRKI